MRLAVTLVLLVGCYQPDVPTGVRCSESGECPAGQLCDLVLGVCGGPPTDGSIDTPSDVPGDTMIDAPILGAWNPPVSVGAVNTLDIETDPAISADGLELFFSSNRPGIGGHDIYRATRTSTAAAFGTPVLVVELSTAAGETSGHLTRDGLSFYFSRSGEIFRATRPTTVSAFGSPVLDAALSTPGNDVNPALAPDGLTASVTREITVGDRDLYLYTRTSTTSSWSAGVLIAALQTPVTDSGAEFTSDPLELYFHSDRTAATDIYTASRPSIGAPFDSPVLVAELSTAAQESDPSVTADRRTIVFERAANIMIATR